MLKRYPHNLSHKATGTVNMGRCYPATIFEVFPGDSFRIQAENLTRFMPQISPTMTEVNVGIDFYQVPWRQLFDKLGLDWDAFLTGGENGDDTSVLPTITIPETGYEPGGLADWLNYPTNYTDPESGEKVIVGAGLKLNGLPVVAYMHVINENYRDQNFIAKLDLSKYQEFLDGEYAFTTPAGDPIEYELLVNGLFRKAWSRDYFGRAMSNTQRGPAVRVPMVGNAPIINAPDSSNLVNPIIYNGDGTVKQVNNALGTYQGKMVSKSMEAATGSIGEAYMALNADLTGVTAVDLLTFRLAARMQRFGEILQRGGARAVEFTFHMFGVRIPDDRIQRPIFHGSFKLPVIFSEVLQTSQSTEQSPQGTLAGHGITGGVNTPIHIKCIEHGYVIAIMHVMPRPQYQNFVPKYLLRSTRWDIPNPLFQHIGDQPVKRVEIYPNSENPDENFGYVPHYSELSFVPSSIHGLMKGDLLHWTMARVFDTEPVLSAAFRYGQPSKRSFAVQNQDEMQMSIGFHIRGRRPFVKNPQPGLHIV